LQNDLEIIKENKPMQVWDLPEENDFYLLFVPEMWDKVMLVATRMANRIAELEKEKEQSQKFLSAREIEVLAHTQRLIVLEKASCNNCKFFFCTMDDGVCKKDHWFNHGVMDFEIMKCSEWEAKSGSE